MRNYMVKQFFFTLLFFSCSIAFSQTDSTQVFDLKLEFRPRFEYRDGYKELPSFTENAAVFISSRSRFIF